MTRRGYYIECPDCGAHLDPGERCDCQDDEKEKSPRAGTRRDGLEIDSKNTHLKSIISFANCQVEGRGMHMKYAGLPQSPSEADFVGRGAPVQKSELSPNRRNERKGRGATT